MKKIQLGLALITALMISSCEKKVEKTVETTTETTTVVKDTVVKEQAKEEDGTSVKINSDGVDVNSKDVEVEIKK
jgi:hypothetical protein